jgi:hypothetical protein
MFSKISRIQQIFFALVVFIFIASCEYDFIQPPAVVIPEVVSFSDDILPIFNESCNFSGCHVSGFALLDLSPGNAYNDLLLKSLINTDVPDQSKLYQKLTETNGTHQGRSTAAQQAIILEWINKGAKNN